MILAAYLVTGFLVASVYAVGMLRGRRDRHHRLGLLIPLTVAAIATPIQFAVGDTAARAIADDQPIKFAAMECVQDDLDGRDRVHLRALHIGRREGRHRDPGPRLVPRRAGAPTRRSPGSTPCRPTTARPRTRCCTGRSTRWSGICSRADPARAVARRSRWLRRRDIPKTPWFLRAVAVSGVASIVALECGWIVTEVGRQPWIVYEVMRTEDAVTDASGVSITLAADPAPLHGARRRDGGGAARDVAALATRPTSASRTFRTDRGSERLRRSRVEQGGRGRGSPVGRGDPLRRVRRRRLRRRAVGAACRRRRARQAATRPDRLGDRPGLGGQPRLADLRAGGAVDRVPGRLRIDLLDALHPAQPRGARDRAARRRLCLPRSRGPRRGQARGRGAVRRLVRAHALLHGHRRRRDRVGPRAGRQRDRATPSRAGSTRCRCSSGRCSWPPAPTWRRCS